MNLKQLTYIVKSQTPRTSPRPRTSCSSPAGTKPLSAGAGGRAGTPLFRRIGRKLVPTYAGQLYVDAARQILDIKKQTYKPWRKLPTTA